MMYYTKQDARLLKTPDNIPKVIDWYRNAQATPSQRELAWQFISDIVSTRTRNHYGRKQIPGIDVDMLDRHHDRMIQFIQFIRDNPRRSIPWCIHAYKMRFAQFEAVLNLSRKGIAVQSSTSAEVKYTNIIERIMRGRRGQFFTVDDVLVELRKCVPTIKDDTLRKRIRQWMYLDSYSKPEPLNDETSSRADAATIGVDREVNTNRIKDYGQVTPIQSLLTPAARWKSISLDARWTGTDKQG